MECETCLHSFFFKLVIIESFEYLVTLYYLFSIFFFPNPLHLPTQLIACVEQTVRSKNRKRKQAN